MRALIGRLTRLAALQPVLMTSRTSTGSIPTTLELFSLAIDEVRSHRVLMVATSRPEFTPRWPSHRHISTVALTRLDRREGEALVTAISRGKQLPPEVLDQIVERTDGVPLFIEELTKTVIESGLLREAESAYELAGPLPPLGIPSTLYASLLARLDRLASAKNVAQIGAIIGREFTYKLIAAVAALPEYELQGALAQLVAAELIFQRGVPPEASYQFKHALVQEAAYSTLLRTERRRLHGAVARVLEERFGDLAATEPELLAHHLTEAGIVEAAIDYWHRAGELAISHAAYREAANHLKRGMDLIHLLPPAPTRDRKELDLHLLMVPTMRATRGSALDTERVLARAHDLVAQTGTIAEQMTVLIGFWNLHWGRAEHRAAFEIAQRCMALATQHHHRKALGDANRMLGFSLVTMGKFAEARRALTTAIDLATFPGDELHELRQRGLGRGRHTVFSYLARALWLLGYPQQAIAASAQSVCGARSEGSAVEVAVGLTGEMLIGVFGGDSQRLATQVDELVAYSAEHNLINYEQWGRFCQGTILAARGNLQEGITIMRSAMASAEGMDAQVFRPMQFGLLATAYSQLGQPEVGLDLLDHALQAARKTEELFFEAELCRRQAELLLGVGKKDEAESSLHTSLAIARNQEARWWELRSAVTLAEHWQREGRLAEARDLLSQVLSWFTEGFDLADLSKARALLNKFPNTAAEAQGAKDAQSAQ